MPTIDINNRSMHYLDQGEGPVLLFGHSYLWDHNMWQHQINELSQFYRCIVPDLWGHGHSALLESSPSIQSLADDHWQLMQALKIDRFSIVGLSVGGMWGIQMALDHPNNVERLVIMDSFAGIEPSATQQSYLQMLDIVEQAGAVPPPLIQQLIPVFLSAVTLKNQPELASSFSQSLSTLAPENIPSIVAIGRSIFTRTDLMPALPDLKMPVHILVGELDQPRPPQEAKQMACAIDKATLNVIADAGHISALEQPAQVNSLLLSFLQS